MIIVPGSGHMFEEPGRLDRVVDHAQNGFPSHSGNRE